MQKYSPFMERWVQGNNFIHALCDVKGVKDAVTSPTFSIINEYSYLEEGLEGKYSILIFTV